MKQIRKKLKLYSVFKKYNRKKLIKYILIYFIFDFNTLTITDFVVQQTCFYFTFS